MRLKQVRIGRGAIAILGVAGWFAVAPAAQAVVLHDQFAPSGANITSQDYAPSDDAFDDLAADDFLVPQGQVWHLDRVEANGSDFGSGATNAKVFLFGNSGTLPGTQLFAAPSVAFPSLPDLNLALTGTPVLPAGTYWVGVQVNSNQVNGMDWGWDNRAPQFGFPAVWRNPGNGFASGCTTFAPRGANCASDPANPDQAYRISGEMASSEFEATAKAKSNGKVRITVNAPNVGGLVAKSKQLKKVTKELSQIGETSFKMKPKSAIRGTLEDGDKVKAKVKLLLPGLLGGATLSDKVKVKLKS